MVLATASGVDLLILVASYYYPMRMMMHSVSLLEWRERGGGGGGGAEEVSRWLKFKSKKNHCLQKEQWQRQNKSPRVPRRAAGDDAMPSSFGRQSPLPSSSSLSSYLLAGGLASGGFAGGLLGASHGVVV